MNDISKKLHTLKQAVEHELAVELKCVKKRYNGTNNTTLFDILSEFVLRPGKRFRPLLFLLSAGFDAADMERGKELLQLACVFEFLHDFALIHDDIIDFSAVRRQGPCLEKVWEDTLCCSLHNAKACAMISGDILFALAFEQLCQTLLPADIKNNLLGYITRVCVNTGSSQITELKYCLSEYNSVSRQDIYDLYEMKTALYSFVCPVVSGCLVVGKKEADLLDIKQACVLLGQAYQILDDVEELQGAATSFEDIKQGRFTLPLWLTLSGSTPDQCRFICSLVGRTCFDQEEIVYFVKLLKQSGAVEECFSIARKNYEKACAVLQKQVCQGKLGKDVIEFIQHMFNTVFALRQDV